MQRIHFILLQGFIVFHRGITFNLGPNEPFGRGISLNSAPPRPQTEAAARAQRRLLYKPCPRRVPLRGMRSETKGSAPQRAAARRRAVGERQAPPAAGVPVEGAGVPVEGAAGTGVPAGVTAEPAAEVPLPAAGVLVGVDVVVEGAAGVPLTAGVPVEGAAGTGVPGGVTAEPAAEVPLPAAGVPVGVDVVVEGAAGTGVPAGVPVEGGAGTGVPGGVTAEPAAEEPVEGAGAPGVPPPVGEPPCCALAPCFFLSRCTKLTAWSFTERARRMRDEGWNTTCTRLICPTPASSGKPTPAEQRRVGRKEPRSPSRTLRPCRRLSMISTSSASTTAFTSAEARVHFFSMRSMMCMWSSATGVTSWG